MDWAAFFKEYPAIVTAVAGLLGIVLGFVFNGFITRTKRKHELEDRQVNRRIKFRETKVEEVQAYINTYIDVCRILNEYECIVLTNGEMDEETNRDFNRIMGLFTPLRQGLQSLMSLNDLELTKANHELVIHFDIEYRTAVDLIDIYNRIDDFGKHVMLKRMLRNHYDLTAYLTIMQTRLNELAQSVP